MGAALALVVVVAWLFSLPATDDAALEDTDELAAVELGVTGLVVVVLVDAAVEGRVVALVVALLVALVRLTVGLTKLVDELAAGEVVADKPALVNAWLATALVALVAELGMISF